jgi:hypothetical protein
MRSFLLLAILCSVPVCAQTSSTPAPQPPIAKKVHMEKPVNGSVLVDDYGWLSDKQNP